MKLDTLDLPHCLDRAVAAAHAGAAQLEAWRNRFRVQEKAKADLVTEADVASQHAIQEVLLQAFPTHGFLGEEDAVGRGIEETRPPADAPPTWVVDPLDGTVNYVHDVPCYCVSIGLFWQGRPVVGVIYDPRLQECFTAYEGGGAFLNGQPIRVSRCTQLGEGLLATGFPANYLAQQRNWAAWVQLSGVAQALRRTGSTAINLAYLACGRFDGYWAHDNYAWDVMAGVVLVREAGGQVTGIQGGDYDPFRMDILATNGHLHAPLLAALPPTASVSPPERHQNL
jgi:myo-inositol-1(or 4)-monophosphatase